MAEKRFTFLVAVHAFFFKDDKVLLLQRCNTGYMDGSWSVPAGHADGGETIANAMKREIWEEAGVKIGADVELLPAHVMHRIRSNDEYIDYFFVIKEWHSEPRNAEPDKCSGLEWVSLDALPKNMIPYVEFALKEILSENMFSEFEE